MSGSSRYTRAIFAEVGEIERRLRSLERNLERVGARASSDVKDRAEGLGEAVATALFGWADHFRQTAGLLSDQSADVARDAAKLGGKALTRVSKETESHPFFALALAVGVGVLIGFVSRNWDLKG